MKQDKMSKEQRLRLIKQVAEKTKRKREDRIIFSLQINPEMFEFSNLEAYTDLRFKGGASKMFVGLNMIENTGEIQEVIKM